MGKQYLTEHAIIFLEKSSGLSWNYPYIETSLRRSDKHRQLGSIVYAFRVVDSASFLTHACCFIEHACSVSHDGNDEHCCYE